MNDTDVDARLVENARRWQEDRPVGPTLADVLVNVGVPGSGSFTTAAFTSKRRRLSVGAGRQLVAMAAVAAVVAAVVLVGVVIRSQRGDTAHPNGLPAAHPGDVSYHGITLTVPANWQVAPSICPPPPTVDAVVPDTGETAACPGGPQPKRAGTNTLVYLASPAFLSDEVIRIAASKTTVDGVAALRGRGTDGRGTPFLRAVTVLTIPSLYVVIEVAAVNPAVADTILDTVRITPVDQYGCRGRVPSWTPTGNAKMATLLAGRPTSGHICEYASARFNGESGPINGLRQGIWLVGSARLSSAQLAAVTKGLNRFRPRSTVLVDRLPSPEVWFVLKYANGSTRTIATTLDQSPVLAYDGYRVYSGSSDITLPTPFHG